MQNFRKWYCDRYECTTKPFGLNQKLKSNVKYFCEKSLEPELYRKCYHYHFAVLVWYCEICGLPPTKTNRWGHSETLPSTTYYHNRWKHITKVQVRATLEPYHAVRRIETRPLLEKTLCSKSISPFSIANAEYTMKLSQIL